MDRIRAGIFLVRREMKSPNISEYSIEIGSHKTKVLIRLDRILSVQDIMTPAQVLERAGSIEYATRLFKEYDVVPYPKIGRIEGFFKRNSNELIKQITLSVTQQAYPVKETREIVAFINERDVIS